VFLLLLFRFVDEEMWLIYRTGQMALVALQYNNVEVGLKQQLCYRYSQFNAIYRYSQFNAIYRYSQFNAIYRYSQFNAIYRYSHLHV